MIINEPGVSGNKLRFGILGTAQISRKNWRAIRDSGNSIVAVASRDLERSRKFIAECQAEVPFETVPQALGSYEELLASPAVDAVYIPLPTGLRKEWVLRAAAAGKHIVSEKPCAVSVADLREMLEACRRQRVQFMDGVMFLHSQRLDRMRAVLDDGQSVGEIRRITSAFSFCAPPEFFTGNIRASSELEPHGCVGDLGWYCIRFALWVMGWQIPRQVTGRMLNQFQHPGSSAPVPTEFAGELLFADGVSAGFYCSFVTGIEQWANVSGTLGHLEVSDFVLPLAGKESTFRVHKTEFNTVGCEFKMESHSERFTVAEHSHGHATAQEANLFRNFANQVRSGKLDEAWPEMALKTQIVMAACLESARAEGRLIQVA
jgi:predicted dehydrogenase